MKFCFGGQGAERDNIQIVIAGSCKGYSSSNTLRIYSQCCAVTQDEFCTAVPVASFSVAVSGGVRSLTVCRQIFLQEAILHTQITYMEEATL